MTISYRRPWHVAALCLGIAATAPAGQASTAVAPEAVEPSASDSDSSIQPGDRGATVSRLQRALRAAGYYVGPIDGRYSTVLTDSVRAFQKAERLPPSGIAGPATLERLELL